jgi:hypothetical protein
VKQSRFLLAAVLITVPLAAARSLASESRTSLNAVLAKWESASQKCKSLDAKLTIWHYDGVFHDDKPTIEHGRFYYESPGIGRLQIGNTGDEKADDWNGLSEVIVWNGDSTLTIDPRSLICVQYSKAAMHAALDAAEKNGDKPDGGWLGQLFSGFGVALANHYISPQRCLPLVVDIRGDDLRARFDLTIDQRDGRPCITAVPNRKAERECYSKIEVLLDAKTNMTSAIQVFSIKGPHHARDGLAAGTQSDRIVYELSSVKINQRPSDRDRLLDPDVSWIGGQQVARLRPLLTHKSQFVRAYAADQLAGLAYARDALPDLKKLLADKDRSVRDSARAAIAAIESVPACCRRSMFEHADMPLDVLFGPNRDVAPKNPPGKHPAEVARIMKLLPKIRASASADEIIKFLGLPKDCDYGPPGTGFTMSWNRIAPGYHFNLNFEPARKDGEVKFMLVEAAFSSLHAPGRPPDDYYTIYPYRSAKGMVYKDY